MCIYKEYFKGLIPQIYEYLLPINKMKTPIDLWTKEIHKQAIYN